MEILGRRLFWKPQPDALPQITWLRGPTGHSLPQAAFQDLESEIGLRLFVVENGNACDVTAQFHHACCDGVGIQSFGNDLVLGYAMAKGLQMDRLRLPDLDPRRLARRGAYGLTVGKFFRMLPSQLPGLPGAGQFFLRAPRPVLPHRAAPDQDPPPSNFPSARIHTFTREETRALSDKASQLAVTANDLLVRDVYLALGAWRTWYDGGSDNEWLRLMVPTNLRSIQDRLLPAVNAVGSIFLDRRGREFVDPGQLLEGIARELETIRDRRLGLIFIYALNLLGLFPNGLRRIARQRRCRVSGIFSNLGRPMSRSPLPRKDGLLVAGDLVLERMDGVVPFPPHACVTFTAIEYARQLSMTLHFDPRVVSPDKADDLMNMFTCCVRTTISNGQ